MPIYLCVQCKKRRKIGSQRDITKLCMRCSLKVNKVLLLKCFTGIINQPDMKAFKREMEQWYV